MKRIRTGYQKPVHESNRNRKEVEMEKSKKDFSAIHHLLVELDVLELYRLPLPRGPSARLEK